jgi:multicomponent Na+:H+ antiporter subunit B
MTLWLDLPFLVLLAILAVLAVRASRLFYAVLLLGAYGFVLALEWALLGAFDVSFTEAVIGAGAWMVYMLAALRQTTERETPGGGKRRRIGGLVAVLALGAMLVYSTAQMPTWGDPLSPASLHVSPRYIEQAYAETKTPNFVTAVLGDYRSLDTLFEVAVVFTAAMAIALLLGTRDRRLRARNEHAPLAPTPVDLSAKTGESTTGRGGVR